MKTCLDEALNGHASVRKAEPQPPRCERCRWFFERVMECRALPPPATRQWPEVEPDDWCGAFEAKG